MAICGVCREFRDFNIMEYDEAYIGPISKDGKITFEIDEFMNKFDEETKHDVECSVCNNVFFRCLNCSVFDEEYEEKHGKCKSSDDTKLVFCRLINYWLYEGTIPEEDQTDSWGYSFRERKNDDQISDKLWDQVISFLGENVHPDDPSKLCINYYYVGDLDIRHISKNNYECHNLHGANGGEEITWKCDNCNMFYLVNDK